MVCVTPMVISLEKIPGSVMSLHFLLQRPLPFKGCCISVGEEGSLDQA